MPTWSPGPTPWAERWWARRFARSSISLYVRRLPSQTTYSRSPKWSAAFSKRSARLNSTTARLEHVLIERQTHQLARSENTQPVNLGVTTTGVGGVGGVGGGGVGHGGVNAISVGFPEGTEMSVVSDCLVETSIVDTDGGLLSKLAT